MADFVNDLVDCTCGENVDWIGWGGPCCDGCCWLRVTYGTLALDRGEVKSALGDIGRFDRDSVNVGRVRRCVDDPPVMA